MPHMIEYKCPCCGGAVEFNSSIQKMKCPYCDTEFNIEELRKYEETINKDAEEENNKDNNEYTNTDNMKNSETKSDDKTDTQWNDVNLYTCKSCGGEVIADENTAATSCPYCGNPVVMTERISGILKPHYIIPFKLDKKAAKEGLKKHVSGRRLLPKVFKSENHIDKIRGIYVPFWLFDSDTDADMEYKAEKIRMWSDSEYDYTETSYYSVSRAGEMSFAHVPVDGSSKMPDDLMESIEPFYFDEAVEFKPEYLAGYLADKYDVDSEISKLTANNRIKTSTSETFRNTVVGYDRVYLQSDNIKINNERSSYVLYPVWILNTKWNGENYIFAMNGQTGKFVGNMPLDKKAFVLYFIGLAILIGAIIFGILWIILM